MKAVDVFQLSGALLCLLLVTTELVQCRPTIYKRNENDKLEPVLIAVSSTVIPLPIYKVALNVGVGSGKKAATKPDGTTKLITAYKKKGSSKEEDEEDINIKEISKDA